MPVDQSDTKQMVPNCFFFRDLKLCIGEPAHEKGNYIPVHVIDSKKLKLAIINCLEGKYANDIILFGYDSKEMYADFKRNFKLMRAAGGVVQNDQGHYLFIKRHGIWDLPKGKIEKGESDELAAIREVTEETGISEPVIKDKLTTTFHIYKTEKHFFLKETAWYLMYVDKVSTLKPQLEEDITDVVWLSKDEAAFALKGSYRSLRDSLGNVFID